MTTQAEFRRICERGGFKEIDKRYTPHGYILLGERVHREFHRYPHPYLQTIWAIERDDMDAFGLVRNDTVMNRGPVQAVRIKEAVAKAEQYIRDNLEVGRYG